MYLEVSGARRPDDWLPLQFVCENCGRIGTTEVTQGQYRAVVGANPSHFKGQDDYPVENVTWFAAVKFCNDLSVREGLPPFFEILDKKVNVPNPNGLGFRLPTEA